MTVSISQATYDDPCNVSKIIADVRNLNSLETPCIICGDPIAIGFCDSRPKICEHCRLAILTFRKRLNASCGNCANWQRDSTADIYWCPVVQDRIEMHDTPCRRWRLDESEGIYD